LFQWVGEGRARKRIPCVIGWMGRGGKKNFFGVRVSSGEGRKGGGGWETVSPRTKWGRGLENNTLKGGEGDIVWGKDAFLFHGG